MTWRKPKVGGIAGGVGTTMVAHLIGGEDIGVVASDGEDQAEVLVTRATAVAVRWAIETAGAMALRPVLVVVAASGERWPKSVEQRLAMATDNLATPILRLGWCPQLVGADNPWDLLAEAVSSPDLKAYSWAAGARRFRGELVTVIAESMATRLHPAPTPLPRSKPESATQ